MDATVTIGLTRGHVTVVDADATAQVLDGSWSTLATGRKLYAVGWVGGRRTLLHRLILGAAPGQSVDHINGDGLDNRRANLRLCTAAQNNANKRKSRGGSSFKGVHWNKEKRAWHAQVAVAGKREFLGYFATEEEAAAAYDAAAAAAFGEFAQLNGVDVSRVRLSRTADRRGERNPSARLREADVLEIRRGLMSGATTVRLASEFGVSRSLVSAIKTGHAWRSVVGPEGWRPPDIEGVLRKQGWKP